MSDFKKNAKRALDDTIFSTNPYTPDNKKEVIQKIKEKRNSHKFQRLTLRLLPIVSLSAAVLIIFILGSNWFQVRAPSMEGLPQQRTPIDIDDNQEQTIEKSEIPVTGEEKIRQMIGKETESKPDTIFSDEGSLPIPRIQESDFSDSYFNVNHFLIDGIDSNNVGYIFEAGFVGLTRASHMLVGSRLPSINYRDDLITIDDAFSIDQVVHLKKQFNELNFIFPAGKYLDEELTQATFVIQSENKDETFMTEVLTAIKTEIPDIPVTVLFTTIENGQLTKFAIGYFNEEPYVQLLDGLVYGPNDKLSEHLSTKFNFVFDETIDGYRNTFNLISAQGITNEKSVRYQIQPSTDAKTVSLVIYGVTRLDMDNLNPFIEDIIEEIYTYYSSTDIAIEIYINNDEVWDGKFVPEKAVIVFPNEEDWFVYEF